MRSEMWYSSWTGFLYLSSACRDMSDGLVGLERAMKLAGRVPPAGPVRPYKNFDPCIPGLSCSVRLSRLRRALRELARTAESSSHSPCGSSTRPEANGIREFHVRLSEPVGPAPDRQGDARSRDATGPEAADGPTATTPGRRGVRGNHVIYRHFDASLGFRRRADRAVRSEPDAPRGRAGAPCRTEFVPSGALSLETTHASDGLREGIVLICIRLRDLPLPGSEGIGAIGHDRPPHVAVFLLTGRPSFAYLITGHAERPPALRVRESRRRGAAFPGTHSSTGVGRGTRRGRSWRSFARTAEKRSWAWACTRTTTCFVVRSASTRSTKRSSSSWTKTERDDF